MLKHAAEVHEARRGLCPWSANSWSESHAPRHEDSWQSSEDRQFEHVARATVHRAYEFVKPSYDVASDTAPGK